MKLKIGELFCGAGGIGLGAKLANVAGAQIEHVWATDYDKDACETYRHNLGCENVICQDIKAVNFKTFKKFGEINCLAFGFPCNDFSMVGEHKGITGSFGSLYKYCVQALEIFKPSYFVAENVTGLKSANNGNSFRFILEEFANAGYKIVPHLYKFNEYGIPQKRHRIIFVGIRNNLKQHFLVPSTMPYKNIDVSVKTALSHIPQNAKNQEMTNQSPVVVERLKYIQQGENAFTADLPTHLVLNVKGAKISQIYKRLKADEPAYTITGSGGGGTHVYHYKEHRALTNRERARLQTFPDDFEFIGSKESVRKQIGMAVPPIAAKIIFEALLKSILKISYLKETQNIEYTGSKNAERVA